MTDFGARRVLNQNYQHHVKNQFGIDPIETIGAWCVYYIKDLPKDWPDKKLPLAITLTANQIQYLRTKFGPGDLIPVEPEDLPDIPQD